MGWKFLLSLYGFILFLNVLDRLGIPIGAVFLVAFGVGAWLILFLPKPFTKFLYKLVWPPKSIEAHRTDFDKTLRLILILVIQRIHDGFWGFITQFYPFSLFYRDRLFHAKNNDIRGFIAELEGYAKSIHLPFIIRAGDGSGAMSLFWAKQTGGKNIKKQAYLEELTKKLQAKYETIYLTPEASGFTIHVPTNMVKQSQAQDERSQREF